MSDDYLDAEIIDDTPEDDNFRPWNVEVNAFCMLMHLSQFLGLLIPVAGFAMPIVMWAIHKDRSRKVDQHGINILNWIISSFIYVIAAAIVSSIFRVEEVLFGLMLLIDFVLIVVAAVKANEGEIYKYPLAIQFVKPGTKEVI